MPGLIDILPDAGSLLALAPEDLGMILMNLAQKSAGSFTLSHFVMPLWNANVSAYPQHMRTPVARATAEAWQWLQNEGLIMVAPDQYERLVLSDKKGGEDKRDCRDRGVSPRECVASWIAPSENR